MDDRSLSSCLTPRGSVRFARPPKTVSYSTERQDRMFPTAARNRLATVRIATGPSLGPKVGPSFHLIYLPYWGRP
jgi:hypothetical protein